MRRPWRACLLAPVLALGGPALAADGLVAVATPGVPGAWTGTWTLLRQDPRIRTRVDAATLRLQVAEAGNGALSLTWVAGRGICDDPVDEPCEWVGARGAGLVVAGGAGALAALVRVSVDGEDPFLLVLQRAAEGRATGRLVSEKGGIAYRLHAERE